MIPNSFVQDGRIEDATIRVYLYLRSLCDVQIMEQTGKLMADTSIRRMSKVLHKTTKICTKHVKLLESMRWVMVQRIPNKITRYYLGTTSRYLVEDIASNIAIET